MDMDTLIKMLELAFPNGIPPHKFTEAVYLMKMVDKVGETRIERGTTYTIPQAAKLIGKHSATIYAAIKAGKVQVIRNEGEQLKLSAETVESLKESR